MEKYCRKAFRYLGSCDYKNLNEKNNVTITTEFGPPNYMPTLPITKKPTSDQWNSNVFIMKALKKRIKG